MADADLRAPDILHTFRPNVAHGARHPRLHAPRRLIVRLCDVVQHPCRLPYRLALRLAAEEERDALGRLHDGQSLSCPRRARRCRRLLSRQE